MDVLKNDSARMLSRTQFVWIAFFILIPSALFILQIGNHDSQSGLILMRLSDVDERPAKDPVFESIQKESLSQWKTIVIQQLGQPSGTQERVHREHKQLGLDGLGYHFLIGNGNGLGDGFIHVGYRWIEQSPAAKPFNASEMDHQTISICLVGSGDRRPFTAMQLRHVIRLVQRLQVELGIPESNVSLGSTGQFFAEAQFRSQLRDIPSLQ